jgi:predicted lipoprotein with Yx(FWY)xxD motif
MRSRPLLPVRSRPLVPMLAIGTSAVLLASCGGSSSGGGSGGAASGYGAGTPTARTAPAKLALTTESSKLGTLLTDGAKRTVYLFEKDARGRSACAGACASIWPPLTVGGSKPVAGNGVSAQLLGTTTRPGGGRQVTYAGHPLYYYAADQHPGDTSGQGLDQFGAEWYVLAPKGTAIDP